MARDSRGMSSIWRLSQSERSTIGQSLSRFNNNVFNAMRRLVQLHQLVISGTALRSTILRALFSWSVGTNWSSCRSGHHSGLLEYLGSPRFGPFLLPSLELHPSIRRSGITTNWASSTIGTVIRILGLVPNRHPFNR